jgi:hypothetical protein
VRLHMGYVIDVGPGTPWHAHLRRFAGRYVLVGVVRFLKRVTSKNAPPSPLFSGSRPDAHA